MLWKQAYSQTNPEIAGGEENPWKLYQQWMKLDESTRQSWLVAGGTIQAFDKVCTTKQLMYFQSVTFCLLFSLAKAPFKKLLLRSPKR